MTALVFAMVSSPSDPGVGVISPPSAHRVAAAGDIVLFDIRTPAEWAETGVPEGARLVDYNASGPAFAERVKNALGGDTKRPIALICARGGRSSEAREQLREAGFTTVFNVYEGVLGNRSGPGWLARGLPVEDWPQPSDYRDLSQASSPAPAGF